MSKSTVRILCAFAPGRGPPPPDPPTTGGPFFQLLAGSVELLKSRLHVQRAPQRFHDLSLGLRALCWPLRLMPVLSLRAARQGFIEPCLPTRIAQPPLGSGWLHEIK